MLYLIVREGLMCNQLHTLAWLYTLGIKQNEKVVCPVIDGKLKEFFRFQKEDSPIQVEFYECRFASQIVFFMKAVKQIFPKLVSMRLGENTVILDWENFKDMDAFYDNMESVREFFGFKQNILDEADQICTRTRDELACDCLIGVHMRRGDYAEFVGGKWYYTDAEYAAWMRDMADAIGGDKVGFLITSNEKVDLDFYRQRGLRVSCPGKSAVQDLCLLSLCDYIMGPPSSFSIWAALMGNKKRCVLRSRDEKYQPSDFEYMRVRYERGEKFQ